MSTIIPRKTVLLPNEIAPHLLAQVFTAFAQVGGVLVGLVGLLGLFSFESMRSYSHEIDHHIYALELQHWNQTWYVEKNGLKEEHHQSVGKFVDSRVDELKSKRGALIDTSKRGASLFFGSVVMLVSEVLVGIQGIASVGNLLWWKFSICLACITLLVGISLAFVLVSFANQMPTLTTPID